MQEAEITKVTWSHRPRVGDREDSDAWPELSQETQSRQFKCENNRCQAKASPPSAEENNEPILFDKMAYVVTPLLGEPSSRARELMTPERFQARRCPPRTELVPAASRNKLDDDVKRLKRRRYKRTDKISINFEEVLRNAICLKKANLEEAVRLNLNLPGRNPNRLMPHAVSVPSTAGVRTIFMRSSNSRLSRLRRIILIDRDMRAQINMRRPMIAADLNDINFSSLKITADPQLDADYVHGMSSLNFYGKDYRSQIAGAFSRDTVIHDSDIIDKLNELHIQKRRQLCDARAINSATVSEEDTTNDEILEGTMSLGIDDDDKPDIKDCAISNDQTSLTYARNFREYCTNMLTPGLNQSLEKFLGEIVRFQRRYYDKDQNKARYRRRYYSGLKEVQKHVELRKVKFVIIAPDIEKVELKGGLDDQVHKLIDACKQRNVVCCFGLRRRKLGYYTHGSGFVGSIGIANYEGAETLFQNVLVQLAHARNQHKRRTGNREPPIDLAKLNLDDCLMSESILVLMRSLSSSICKIERQ